MVQLRIIFLLGLFFILIRCISAQDTTFVDSVSVSDGDSLLKAEQVDDNEVYIDKARINGNYFKSYWRDTRDIFISPIRWRAKEWIIATGAVGGIALLTTQDLKIRNWCQERTTSSGHAVTKYVLEPWGSGYYSMGTMAAFYLQGLIFKNQRSKKTALLGVKAYLISGVIVNIPKMLFGRKRPYAGDTPNPNIWSGPTTESSYKSMPSGHTTSIFAVATVVAEEYKETIYVPIIAYSIATAASLSRMYSDDHWASDVLAGAVFGWAMGKLIHNRNNWKINVGAYSTKYGNGLTISCPIGGGG